MPSTPLVPILEIATDDQSINLLNNTPQDFGFFLDEWSPEVATYKSGGVVRDSANQDGSRLVSRAFATPVESLNLKARGSSVDNLIQATQELRRLVEAAADFSIRATGLPVYLKTKAYGETTERYAHVMHGNLTGENSPFSQPFLQQKNKAVADDLVLTVARDHWSKTKPLEGECAPLIMNVRDPVGNDTYGARILATQPIAFWKLNETTYTTAANSSQYGTALDGTYGSGVGVGGPFLTGEQAPSVANSGAGEFVNIYTAGLNTHYDGDNLTFMTWIGNTILNNDAKTRYIINVESSAGDSLRVFKLSGSAALRVEYTVDGLLTAVNMTMPGTYDTWERVVVKIGDSAIYPGYLDVYIAGVGTSALGYALKGAGWTGNLVSTDTTLMAEDTTPLSAQEGDQAYATIWNRVLTQDELNTLGFDVFNTLELQTCLGMPVGNRVITGSLTHIYHYDASITTYTIIDVASLPENLLPATPAAADITYFGSATVATPASAFNTITMNLTGGTGLTTGVWEYWSGAAWTAISNINDGSTGLTANGYVHVAWTVPSNWATNDPGMGITGYWVRYRITAVSSPTPPIIDEFYPFTARSASLSVPATSVPGDINPALTMRIRSLLNLVGLAQANTGGRLIIGTRSQVRGNGFSAYLNASDSVSINPSGVSVAAGTDAAYAASFTADVQAPGLKRLTYNPSGTHAFDPVLIYTFDHDLAREYHGEYRAFIRMRRTGGASTDVTFRLTANFINLQTSQEVQAASTTQFLLLDMGPVTIVSQTGGVLQTSSTGTLAVEIQCDNAGASDVYIYDLILIPQDEWSCDVFSPTGAGSMGDNYALIVDGIAYPYNAVLAYLWNTDLDAFFNAFVAITASRPALQARTAQKIWFLSTDNITANIAEPSAAFLVQTDIKTHYLSAVGNE